MTGSNGRVAARGRGLSTNDGADACARASSGIAPWQFDEYVLAEADGYATPEQLSVLEADPAAWRVSLGVMLREAEENLQRADRFRATSAIRSSPTSSSKSSGSRPQSPAQIPERAVEPKPRRATRQEQAGEQRAAASRPGAPSSRCRGSPDAVVAWAGGPQAPAGSAKRSPRCWPRPVRRSRGGIRILRSCCPVA